MSSNTGPKGISRFSSRRKRLTGVLPDLLKGATSYDRIAGYFSSSMLEVAGEAIEAMKEGSVVRVVCNSELMPADVVTIQSATRAANLSMQEEWTSNLPSGVSPGMRERLKRLYQFLSEGKLKIKVIPDEVFGLIHGKAGVITRADESKVGLFGSVNESRRAWKENYELLYLDESPEGIAWIAEEFEQLWNNASTSFELAPSVIDEIGRLSKRVVVHTIPEWKDIEENPASVAVELPVYRKSNGLWPHQKYFVDLAFRHHRLHGARFVLADQVGLGKTLQLGLVAKLVALSGSKPILILAPKPLLEQWQNEMWSMLAFPIARWDGRRWIDEQGVQYPAAGPSGIKKCPRRAGIVSAGLITANSQAAGILRDMSWDCVILDEAHKARRKNLKPEQRGDPADSNNLLEFMRTVAANSRSVVLATATPVQLDPIEAWDLLDVLAAGNDFVLGDSFSAWRNQVPRMFEFIMGSLEHLLIRWNCGTVGCEIRFRLPMNQIPMISEPFVCGWEWGIMISSPRGMSGKTFHQLKRLGLKISGIVFSKIIILFYGIPFAEHVSGFRRKLIRQRANLTFPELTSNSMGKEIRMPWSYPPTWRRPSPTQSTSVKNSVNEKTFPQDSWRLCYCGEWEVPL